MGDTIIHMIWVKIWGRHGNVNMTRDLDSNHVFRKLVPTAPFFTAFRAVMKAKTQKKSGYRTAWT